MKKNAGKIIFYNIRLKGIATIVIVSIIIMVIVRIRINERKRVEK